MPQTAAAIDSLRQALGREWASRILHQTAGWCYGWERCADGVLREFGARPDGQRARLVDGQVVPPVDPPGVRPALPNPAYAHLFKPKERNRE